MTVLQVTPCMEGMTPEGLEAEYLKSLNSLCGPSYLIEEGFTADHRASSPLKLWRTARTEEDKKSAIIWAAYRGFGLDEQELPDGTVSLIGDLPVIYTHGMSKADAKAAKEVQHTLQQAQESLVLRAKTPQYHIESTAFGYLSCLEALGLMDADRAGELMADYRPGGKMNP